MVDAPVTVANPVETVAMRCPLHLGQTADGQEFNLPLHSLNRHAVIFGASGSGKTVLGKLIVEQALLKGLPVIAVDLQGDIAALALGPNDDSPLAAQFRERVDVKIWTPGSTIGIPVSTAPNLVVSGNCRPEDHARACNTIGQAVAGMIGDKSEVTAAGLAIVIDWASHNKIKLDEIRELVMLLTAPSTELLAALAPLLDKRNVSKLAKAIALKTVGPVGHINSLGLPIDIDELYGLYRGSAADQGRARLSIISLAALPSEEERQRFIGSLCAALYAWMRSLSDPSKFPSMLYIDEILGLLPAVKNPPSKQGLMLLLRQARKFNLALLLASQSPADLDYLAIAQAGSVFVGRLSATQEIKKITPSLLAHGATTEMLASLPAKQAGQFVVMSHALPAPVEIQANPTITPHRVVSLDEIEQIVTDDDRRELGGMTTPATSAVA